MEMQSEHSPSYPSGSLLGSTPRGGTPSALMGRDSKTGATTLFDNNNSSSGSSSSSASGGEVCHIAARPKRPWDDISPASNNDETGATAFMSKLPTLSGVANVAADASTAAVPAKETCGALVTEVTTKAGSVIDLVGGGAPPRASSPHGPGGAGPSMGPSVGASTATTGSSSILSVARNGSEDDMTDSDEKSVISRLAEFTEMARRTAVQNEELSRDLAAEKRRVVHTTRKLEQCSNTCAELRESLTLAQDTVIKLREHEMAWAERTANEMSLRAELCALKDEHSSVSSDAAVLKKRCEAFQLENTELGERFAAIAEEKRQVESRARRLLRSERCRSY